MAKIISKAEAQRRGRKSKRFLKSPCCDAEVVLGAERQWWCTVCFQDVPEPPQKFYVVEHGLRGVLVGWSDDTPAARPRFSKEAKRSEAKQFSTIGDALPHLLKVREELERAVLVEMPEGRALARDEERSEVRPLQFSGTVRVDQDVYAALALLKKPGESMSDVVRGLVERSRS
jgi:hypothetical protein